MSSFDPNYYYRHYVTESSYLAPSLAANEAFKYRAAGVLLYRTSGAAMEVLLGEQADGLLSLLGGKRRPAEREAVVTAVREFHEETGGLLNADALRSVLLANRPSSAPPVPDIEVCWVFEGKYALFLVHVDAVRGLDAASASIEQRFCDFAASPAHAAAPDDFKEMAGVRWVPASHLLLLRTPQQHIKSSPLSTWTTMVCGGAAMTAWLTQRIASSAAVILEKRMQQQSSFAVSDVASSSSSITMRITRSAARKLAAAAV